MEAESRTYADLADALLRVVLRASRLRRARDRVERVLAPMGAHGRRLVLKHYQPPEACYPGAAAPAETPGTPADIADDAPVAEHDLDAEDEIERLRRASPLGDRLIAALDDYYVQRHELVGSIQQGAGRINELHGAADSDIARRWLELLFRHLDRLLTLVTASNIGLPDWDPAVMAELLGEIEHNARLDRADPSMTPTGSDEHAERGLRGQIERLRLLPGQGSPSDAWHEDAIAALAGEEGAPSTGSSLDSGGLHSLGVSVLMREAPGGRVDDASPIAGGGEGDGGGTTQHARDANPHSPPSEEDGEYRPASWFGKVLAARLRQAARPDRKTKRVRSRVIDGVKCYSVNDARRWWPEDMPKNP